MRSRAWHVLQWVAGLLIVVFVIRYVARNWAEVRAADLAWDLSPPLALAGMAIVWVAFALLAEAWRRMVEAWGFALSWRDGAGIWLLSSMAKYVPGKVWALAGMAAMAERRGIPAWCAAGSAVVLQLVSIGSGALVVAASGLAAGGGIPGPLALVGVAAGLLVIILLALWPPLARRAVAAVAPAADLSHVPRAGTVGFGAMANGLAWVGYGLAFWLFSRACLPQAPIGLLEATGAYTASYVAGVLAPFAPGGLGVREGVLVLALQGQVGLTTALALAAVARLGMTASEILATIPFLLRARTAARD